MTEIKSPIPSRIYNAATNGHVCGANDVDFGSKVVHLVPEKTFEEQVTTANTIYVIHDDFTLASNVTIPANCVLEFDGGSIANSTGNNYAIKGQFSINDCHYQIFNNVNFLDGQTFLIVDFIRPEWFGAKGDYNYTTGIGTDDSDAINKAIDVANTTSVNCVKLSGTSYFIDSGIVINNGNIKFTGVYADLREELRFDSNPKFSDRYQSTLVASQNCTKIVTLAGMVTHPVHFEWINFHNFTNNYSCIGISVESTFRGPLWPIYIKYCHFYRLHIAFDSHTPTLAYNIGFLYFEYNAFKFCDYVLKFEPTEEGAETFSGHNNNVCFSLKFTDNQVHHNAVIFKDVYVIRGYTDICRNNFESHLTEFLDNSDVLEHWFQLHFNDGQTITITDNYTEDLVPEFAELYVHEQHHTPHPTQLTILGNKIENNESYGYPVFKLKGIKSQTNLYKVWGLNKVEVLQCDSTLLLEGSLDLYFECPIPNINIGDINGVNIASKHPIERTDVNNAMTPILKSVRTGDVQNAVCTFQNGQLFFKTSQEAAFQICSENVTISDINNVYVIGTCKTISKYVTKITPTDHPLIGLTDNVTYPNGISCMPYKDYNYYVSIKKLMSPISVYKLFIYNEYYLRNTRFNIIRCTPPFSLKSMPIEFDVENYFNLSNISSIENYSDYDSFVDTATNTKVNVISQRTGGLPSGYSLVDSNGNAYPGI